VEEEALHAFLLLVGWHYNSSSALAIQSVLLLDIYALGIDSSCPLDIVEYTVGMLMHCGQVDYNFGM